MKFTEGAFKDWGYETGPREVPRPDRHRGRAVREARRARRRTGKVVIKDRIADSMFQQIQLRPDEYSVIATPNLNGDYLSDAGAAQVGGIGLAPGANIGRHAAMFEATHGTAPKYTGKDLANPGSVMLSGVLMLLEHLGWDEAAERVQTGLAKAVERKTVTYDLPARWRARARSPARPSRRPSWRRPRRDGDAQQDHRDRRRIRGRARGGGLCSEGAGGRDPAGHPGRGAPGEGPRPLRVEPRGRLRLRGSRHQRLPGDRGLRRRGHHRRPGPQAGNEPRRPPAQERGDRARLRRERAHQVAGRHRHRGQQSSGRHGLRGEVQSPGSPRRG